MKCKDNFFGGKALPEISFTGKELEELALENTNMGLSVTGVQRKLSLHLSSDKPARLTLVGYPSGYILKPQSDEFEQLPEAEDLVMDIAEMMGAKVVPHGLIDTPLGLSYICGRVDRTGEDKLAMEDFCQLSGRLTEDKYKGSYEKCAAIIREHSSRLGFDLSEFYLRLVICFVTGNSDMHLKNFSMIETEPGSRIYCLSPAYDLLPVNLVMPEDTEETALTLNGRKSNISRRDFMEFAENIKLNNRVANRLLDEVIGKSDAAIELCENSQLREEAGQRMKDLIRRRTERLKQ